MHRPSAFARGPAAALLGALAAVALAAPAVQAARTDPFALGVARGGNPLAGAHYFVDRHYGLAARQERYWRAHGRRGSAALIDRIAREPETHRFGSFTPDPRGEVRAYLARAAGEAPGTVPAIATYRLLHRGCGGYDGGGAADARRARRWFDALADGIGRHRVLVFVEIDGILTTGCLSGAGRRYRYAVLRHAVAALAAQPHVAVYLDGGSRNGGASSAGVAAKLRQAGIARANGFFLNATHAQRTASEISFGKAVSGRLGGTHFVVSTAVNGRGPRIGRDGLEQHCNPRGLGLGTPPTTQTHDPRVDALWWIGNPGRSAGSCGRGDPPNGTWWPSYALGLARRQRI